jgi:hypothetical protein
MSTPEVDQQGGEFRWRKSTRSAANGACVEIAETPVGVLVRDSKDAEGPRLEFGSASWRAFVSSVRAGAFDGP